MHLDKYSKVNVEPTVVVMMATFNGGKYIEEQLQSIFEQRDVRIVLYVRDDGSTDNTLEILKNFIPDSNIFLGNRDGAALNFWTLLKNVEKITEENYYAWADQDDIWDSGKLISAIKYIEERYNNESISNTPILYSSANRYVGIDGKNIDALNNSATPHSHTFGQALVKSDVQGATMLFNRPLIEKAAQFTPDFRKIHLYHDAWINKVCYAIGGQVLFDPIPHISYRIHGNNELGTAYRKTTLSVKIKNFFDIKNPGYNSLVANMIKDNYCNNMPCENYKIARYLADYKTNLRYKMLILFSKEFKTGIRGIDLRFMYLVLVNKA